MAAGCLAGLLPSVTNDMSYHGVDFIAGRILKLSIVSVCIFIAFNALYAKLGCSSSEEVILHMTPSFCLPILLYSLESITLSQSILNIIEYCWAQVLHRIFKISSNINFKYV